MGQRARQRKLAQLPPDRGLPAWTPFVRTELARRPLLAQLAHNERLASEFGTDVSNARALNEAIYREEQIWVNSRYQVNVRHIESPAEGWPPMVHLSIKRRDKAQVGPERYRDFMAIKDELVGRDAEAVELYPARNREIDSANQYHLWCIAPGSGVVFPFGWHEGRRVHARAGSLGSGAVQAPFEPHHNGGDA